MHEGATEEAAMPVDRPTDARYRAVGCGSGYEIWGEEKGRIARRRGTRLYCCTHARPEKRVKRVLFSDSGASSA